MSDVPTPRVVHNHRITGYHTLQSVVGVENYMGRALVATGSDDIIMLPGSLREEWRYVDEHYDRIGLPCARTVIWDERFDGFRDYPDADISVFMFTDEVHRVLPDENWREITAEMNSKNRFIEFCHKLDIPVPATRCYGSRHDFDCDSLALEYPVFGKLAVSATGVGVHRCNNRHELTAFLNAEAGLQPFQVQRAVEDAFAFVNVGYEVRDGEVHRDIVTAQILDGVEHTGNQYPTRYQPWELTDVLASHIGDLGFRGKFAFDVAVAGTEMKPRFLVLECNPRWNGSQYSAAAAQKLGAMYWESRYFKTSHRSLRGIDLGELEYSPDRKTGVVIVNWGPVVDGKLGCLLIGETPEHATRLAEATRELLL